MKDLFCVKGRVIAITGATGILGSSMVEHFASVGARVVIMGRNREAGERLEKAAREAGGEAMFLECNVLDKSSLERCYDAIMEAYGRIDVLINNAQASASGVTIQDHTTEQFNLAMYSGLYATFYYMKACYPYLKETKGSIINFASGAGLFGNKGQASYAAAKEGIRGLSRVAANEWAADGINVNVVCPLAWTSQLEQFQNAYPEAFAANVHTPPMGRFGRTEEDIGRVCVHLASPDFKYMTGETLTLEGGLGLRP
jgi:NAD(P)-dependent dehydrogenase (short-subunit alcohol dehydrogenase family)